MHLEPEHIYHIYNQGNNRQKIFFNSENYLFFLKKIRTHILPYADILAWCLMPNHFHLMVYVLPTGIATSSGNISSVTTGSATSSGTPSKHTLNDSIGKMLSSYTRANNKQENYSGSLFREKTKAECVTKQTEITPSFLNSQFGTVINVHSADKDYPNACFDYIHKNPVKAKLVENQEDWIYSSYSDYFCGRKGSLINKDRAKELITMELYLD